MQRLVDLVAGTPGVVLAHINDRTVDEGRDTPGGELIGAKLCLHYDPRQVSLAELEAKTRAAGAEITNQYGHALLPFDAIESEDAAPWIEHDLRSEPGVLAASVNLAAQVARVEFDRRLTSVDRVDRALRELLGLRVAPEAAEAPPAQRPGWYARNTELAWSFAAGVLLVTAWVLERWRVFHTSRQSHCTWLPTASVGTTWCATP